MWIWIANKFVKFHANRGENIPKSCKGGLLFFWNTLYVPYRQPNGWADPDQTLHMDLSWSRNCIRQVTVKVEIRVGVRMEAPWTGRSWVYPWTCRATDVASAVSPADWSMSRSVDSEAALGSWCPGLVRCRTRTPVAAERNCWRPSVNAVETQRSAR